MNGSTRLLLIAAIAGQYGCATTMPGQRVATADARGSDADRMRSAIGAALIASDSDVLFRAVAEDAVLVLPGADTVSGRAGIAALLTGMAQGAQPYDVGFEREGVYVCPDGRFQDYGRYAALPQGDPEGLPLTGRYAMLWTPVDSGAAILNAATIYRAGSDRTYRRRPCSTSAEIAWKSPGIIVVLQPAITAEFVTGWIDAMDSRMAATGWGADTTNAQRYSGRVNHNASIGHALDVRKLVHPRAYLHGTVTTLAGRAGVVADNRGLAVLEYDGLVLGALAGTRLGPLSVAAGPAYLGLRGTWTTLFETQHPSFEEPPSDWNSWALGGAAEFGLILPLSDRVGADFRLQHRYFPNADVAGYRGSEAMAVGFSHSTLRSGLAFRF